MNAEYMREGFKSLALIGLALGVPLMALSPPDELADTVSEFTGETNQATAKPASAAPSKPVPTVDLEPGETTVKLPDVIRFDRSAQWVEQQWGDLATPINVGRYRGYQVPVTTGGDEYDVTGMLTYYFDEYGVIQVIEFVGGTNDYGPLATLIQQRYGFIRRPTKNLSVLVFERATATSGQKPSHVWIEPSVGQIPLPRPRRYAVNVFLQRPS